MKSIIRSIAAIVIGSAVFFVLNRYVSIPSGIPGIRITIAYAFLAFMAAVFGPVAGTLIGLIGHIMTDSGGTIGWSWVFVSAFFGCVIGFCRIKFNVEDREFGLKDIMFFNLFQIIANVIGWIVIAPFLDIHINKAPVDQALLRGIAAAASNLVTVAVFGTIFLRTYARILRKRHHPDQQ